MHKVHLQSNLAVNLLACGGRGHAHVLLSTNPLLTTCRKCLGTLRWFMALTDIPYSEANALEPRDRDHIANKWLEKIKADKPQPFDGGWSISLEVIIGEDISKPLAEAAAGDIIQMLQEWMHRTRIDGEVVHHGTSDLNPGGNGYMITATRETAGERPRCVECGAMADFIELNARWSCCCEHGLESYFTKAGIDRYVRNAETKYYEAVTLREKFNSLPKDIKGV